MNILLAILSEIVIALVFIILAIAFGYWFSFGWHLAKYYLRGLNRI